MSEPSTRTGVIASEIRRLVGIPETAIYIGDMNTCFKEAVRRIEALERERDDLQAMLKGDGTKVLAHAQSLAFELAGVRKKCDELRALCRRWRRAMVTPGARDHDLLGDVDALLGEEEA